MSSLRLGLLRVDNRSAEPIVTEIRVYVRCCQTCGHPVTARSIESVSLSLLVHYEAALEGRVSCVPLFAKET